MKFNKPDLIYLLDLCFGIEDFVMTIRTAHLSCTFKSIFNELLVLINRKKKKRKKKEKEKEKREREREKEGKEKSSLNLGF